MGTIRRTNFSKFDVSNTIIYIFSISINKIDRRQATDDKRIDNCHVKFTIYDNLYFYKNN